MGLRDFISRAFSSGLRTVTNAGAKAVTSPIKDVSGTAKDVTGIRKDLVETKLAQYKVEEHESLIQRATLDDVKRFDEACRKLMEKVVSESHHDFYRHLDYELGCYVSRNVKPREPQPLDFTALSDDALMHLVHSVLEFRANEGLRSECEIMLPLLIRELCRRMNEQGRFKSSGVKAADLRDGGIKT